MTSPYDPVGIKQLLADKRRDVQRAVEAQAAWKVSNEKLCDKVAELEARLAGWDEQDRLTRELRQRAEAAEAKVSEVTLRYRDEVAAVVAEAARLKAEIKLLGDHIAVRDPLRDRDA